MAEVAQQYRIINPGSLEDLTNQVNRIFAQMADRADGQEGRRGTPTFHSTVDMNSNKAVSGSAATADTDLPVFGQVLTQAEAVAASWPVGSIFVSVSATNPGTLLGIGTWVAFGTGRVLVGIDSADADWDTVEETGGAKTASIANHTHSTPAHLHPAGATVDANLDLVTLQVSDGTGGAGTSGAAGAASISTVQPYIAVYFWKRTV